MLTFLDYYEQEIQPQIAALDVFLKSEEPPYDSDTARDLLGISPECWERLLQEEKISFITRGILLQLMKKGDSPLCGMFRRASMLYLPEAYTPEVIAYIFDLPIAAVRAAARHLKGNTFTDAMLPQIFARISLADTRFPF
ncbi:MAG: hypothetical protein Q4C06_01340 [Bacillota bacterium]|nr:hypothetical protein [Bacillota bacterium]